ncbi:hypothetical protein IG631_10575 [Alternaria alternata]|nr:hypothetical protein IG631_10575 [Alternaria alternata]
MRDRPLRTYWFPAAPPTRPPPTVLFLHFQSSGSKTLDCLIVALYALLVGTGISWDPMRKEISVVAWHVDIIAV